MRHTRALREWFLCQWTTSAITAKEAAIDKPVVGSGIALAGVHTSGVFLFLHTHTHLHVDKGSVHNDSLGLVYTNVQDCRSVQLWS